MKLLIKFKHYLFSNPFANRLGSVNITVTGNKVRFGKFNLEPEYSELSDYLIRVHRDVIRSHVKMYMEDSKYSILWNEDTGWESEIETA